MYLLHLSVLQKNLLLFFLITLTYVNVILSAKS